MLGHIGPDTKKLSDFQGRRAISDPRATTAPRRERRSRWPRAPIAAWPGCASQSRPERFSIAGRDLERELVPMLTEEKLGLMVWSPLAGGLLSANSGPEATAERAPARQLRFPAGGPGPRLGLRGGDARDRRGARGVGGPRRPGLAAGQAARHQRDHRRQDRRATGRQPGRRRSDPDRRELARLDAVSALPAEYPGWMLARQGGGRRPKATVPAGGH